MSNMLQISPLPHLRGLVAPSSTIIAVGGGKGGVGKSFVSSNTSLFLARQGYKVNLIDLDLGAANIHTCIGEPVPRLGLSDFLYNEKLTLEEVMAKAQHISTLRFLSGSNDALDMANLNESQKSRLMSAIFHLPGDFTVLDLSAGTHTTTLDFFIMAQKHLVTITPEPSSIENAYRFMKAAFYRKIRRHEMQFQLQDIVAELMKNSSVLGIRSPADLLSFVAKKDPVNGAELIKMMNNLEFNIVLNQVRTFKDVEMGQSIQSVCLKYFGVPSRLAGHLDYDNAAWQSLRKRRPLLLEYPHSRLYSQFMSIARDLAHPKIHKAVV